MASPVMRYQREMHRNLGFFATWFPGDHLELGDLGVLENGRFRKESSLFELGIDVKPSDPSAPQTLQFTSASGTTVNSSMSAGVASVGEVEISIEFSSEGAFLFHASGVSQIQIEDRIALGRKIQMAYDRGEWNKDW